MGADYVARHMCTAHSRQLNELRLKNALLTKYLIKALNKLDEPFLKTEFENEMEGIDADLNKYDPNNDYEG